MTLQSENAIHSPIQKSMIDDSVEQCIELVKSTLKTPETLE
jgi:hypothetical protein